MSDKTSTIWGGELPASNLTLYSTAAAGTSDYISLRTGSQVEALKIDTNGNVRLLKPLVPNASDGAALGSASLMWSDLFLASGGVINWNNGDVTATHSANTLAFAGASSGYSFDAALTASTLNGATITSTTFNGVTLDTGAWTAYTPTIAALSGTFTTVSATGRYKKIGRVVHLYIRISITTNGTAATAITATLPSAAASGLDVGCGFVENNSKAVSGIISSGVLAIFLYDGSYPGSNGYNISVSITYESAA